MDSFLDAQLGEIVVRRSARTRSIRIRVGTDGRLVASIPRLTPLFLIKQTVRASRSELSKLLETSRGHTYRDGDKLGQSHTLRIRSDTKTHAAISGHVLRISLPGDTIETDPDAQAFIRTHVIKLLRKEAKIYLDVRLSVLARRHGFSYSRVRYTHAATRWGSCSSGGTISLNIALMSLPLELIDYVLIHELCHTRQMNHSKEFWAEVAALDPHYKLHRRQLKSKTPVV